MTDGRLIATTCRAETNILRCDELTLRTNLQILYSQPSEDRKFQTSFLNAKFEIGLKEIILLIYHLCLECI